MKIKIIKFLKAAIIPIIVAFLFVILTSYFFIYFGKEKFELATTLLELITVRTENKVEELKPILKEKKLINYPTYGSNYATLKISTIDVELPVYFGESYTVLKSGIGHDSSSHFPGEGGSIIYMGHNFKSSLKRLPEAAIEDEIEIETNYGNFKYNIYDTKIINETQVDLVPIQEEEEILMIYTCYPINNIGHAYQRYVVYAKPVD